MRGPVLFSIRFYQKILSLDTGLIGRVYPVKICRFTPRCSQYAYEAVERYGVVRGLYMGIKRLLRCRPGSLGGYDPVK